MDTTNESPLFYLKSDTLGYNATGIYNLYKKEFTILSGSKIRLTEVPSLHPGFTQLIQLRKEILLESPDGILLRDISVKSPSSAGVIVTGTGINGRKDWRDLDGQTFAQQFPKIMDENHSTHIPRSIAYCWLLSTKKDLWYDAIEKGQWQYTSTVEHQREKLHQIQVNDLVVLHWTKNSTLTHNGQTFPNVSTIYIKALGKVMSKGDAQNSIEVDWFEVYDTPREWYFYSLPGALIWKIDYNHHKEKAYHPKLIDFIFHDAPQDIDWFRNQPFWHDRYGDQPQEDENEPEEISFLAEEQFDYFLRRLKEKQNIILQGPPGTGKTWIARHLAMEVSPETRVKKIQFHQNFSYEDFVQGNRVGEDQSLSLEPGVMLKLINEAIASPTISFVLIIDEINRGNPSSIFGEMLTLIEKSKRLPDHAITLTYGKESIYIPKNIYIIGTMNLADHSLAHLDIALRRRFAFLELEPLFTERWLSHLKEKSQESQHYLIGVIKNNLANLNNTILKDPDLGKNFLIGHSFVTPNTFIFSIKEWFHDVIESEIKPLLEEYWLHDPSRVYEEIAMLKKDFILDKNEL